MKTTMKKICTLAAMLLLVLLCSSSVFAAVTPREYGMVRDGSDKYYFIDYKMLKNQWKVSLGDKYYFGADGKAVKGAVKFGDKYYFFTQEGKLLQTGEVSVQKVGTDYYCVYGTGRVKTSGWYQLRYYGEDGKVLKGIQNVDGKWWAFDEQGNRMSSDLTQIKTFGTDVYCINRSGSVRCSAWYQNHYFGKDGKAYKGPKIVDGKYWLFGTNGALVRPSAPSIQKYGSQYYGVNTDGTVRTGWYLLNNELYYGYCKTYGAIFRNKTWLNVTFNSNGTCVKNYTAKAKIEALKLVEKATNEKMTREEKLKACFYYIADQSRFRYWLPYDPKNVGASAWQHMVAYQFLSERKGTCTGFAVGFAACADVLGYNSTIVRGRIPGSRDQAADGLTRHTWIKIDGKVYDPEGMWARFNPTYATNGYPLRHQIVNTYDYRSYY
ncbi:MAG: hypothetical protein KBT01_01220 [Clostridiales bacterium]|nr:hypothetical protein [Candidatus Blautia equi]